MMQEWREIITRLGALLLFAFCAIWCLGGCSRPKPPQMSDVIDRDFAATIAPTSDPLAFVITVKKVNLKSRKEIVEGGNQFGLTIKNATGGILSEPDSYKQKLTRVSQSTKSILCRVRVFPQGLPSGLYTIEPKVRILETGKDALSGPYSDGGSVAIPAHNTLTITIK